MTGEPDAVLDVREIEGAPFEPIMDAIDDLEDDERLLLIAPFEPVPLYEVLDRKGFSHETATPEPGEYHVQIYSRR